MSIAEVHIRPYSWRRLFLIGLFDVGVLLLGLGAIAFCWPLK